VTGWIQDRANALLADGRAGVERVPFERARRASTTHRFDYVGAYIADLGSVVDLDRREGELGAAHPSVMMPTSSAASATAESR
jgi:phosphoglucomutase